MDADRDEQVVGQQEDAREQEPHDQAWDLALRDLSRTLTMAPVADHVEQREHQRPDDDGVGQRCAPRPSLPTLEEQRQLNDQERPVQQLLEEGVAQQLGRQQIADRIQRRVTPLAGHGDVTGVHGDQHQLRDDPGRDHPAQSRAQLARCQTQVPAPQATHSRPQQSHRQEPRYIPGQRR